MDIAIKLLIERFLGFFTRSVAPSSLFIVLLCLVDYFFQDKVIINLLIDALRKCKEIGDVVFYIYIVMLLLTYGYINQVLTQFLDNFIKENYDDNDSDFKNLRKAVIAKFEQSDADDTLKNIIEKKDYMLYLLLSNLTQGASTKTVDETKAIHSVPVSILLVCIMYVLAEKSYIALFVGILLFVIFACITHHIAKSRYKSRNQRLYINYLLGLK